MNKTEYLSNVMQEIEAIKKHATRAEISKLHFGTFSPQARDRCIYGQMTGNCLDPRAVSLIQKCAPIVVEGLTESGRTRVFAELKKYINGEPTSFNIHTGIRRFYSVLESYIALKGAKNKGVIEYLKGEREDLKP